MTAPSNLDQLRAIKDRVKRIHAAALYIEQRETAICEARSIRDADIRSLAEEHGPAVAARMAGVSLSTVKVLRRGEHS